ncbi:hypothetical protein, partial [Arthrobacter ramosus]
STHSGRKEAFRPETQQIRAEGLRNFGLGPAPMMPTRTFFVVISAELHSEWVGWRASVLKGA